MTEDLVGRRVRVYWNLHRHCYSIQDASTRLVIDYSDSLVLADVTFKVSEAGRQRVLREGRKNVHAFVVGTVISEYENPAQWWKVSYNPYKGRDFMMSAHRVGTIQRATAVHLSTAPASGGRAKPAMLAAVAIRRIPESSP